jgi:hypothetical protein
VGIPVHFGDTKFAVCPTVGIAADPSNFVTDMSVMRDLLSGKKQVWDYDKHITGLFAFLAFCDRHEVSAETSTCRINLPSQSVYIYNMSVMGSCLFCVIL